MAKTRRECKSLCGTFVSRTQTPHHPNEPRKTFWRHTTYTNPAPEPVRNKHGTGRGRGMVSGGYLLCALEFGVAFARKCWATPCLGIPNLFLLGFLLFASAPVWKRRVVPPWQWVVVLEGQVRNHSGGCGVKQPPARLEKLLHYQPIVFSILKNNWSRCFAWFPPLVSHLQRLLCANGKPVWVRQRTVPVLFDAHCLLFAMFSPTSLNFLGSCQQGCGLATAGHLAPGFRSTYQLCLKRFQVPPRFHTQKAPDFTRDFHKKRQIHVGHICKIQIAVIRVWDLKIPEWSKRYFLFCVPHFG